VETILDCEYISGMNNLFSPLKSLTATITSIYDNVLVATTKRKERSFLMDGTPET